MTQTLLALVLSLAPFSPGSWKVVDAGCTQPGYQYSADEKAFIDAIHSGYTEDHYGFTDAQHGTYRTLFVESPKVSCVGTADVVVDYPSAGNARLSFGKTTWTTQSTDPNVTIKCGGDESGGDVEDFRFDYLSGRLRFLYPASADCGEYFFASERQP